MGRLVKVLGVKSKTAVLELAIRYLARREGVEITPAEERPATRKKTTRGGQ
jgi:hypothetical protein